MFQSSADDLVTGDSNGAFDLFLYDSASGLIERVSLDENGAQLASSSGSGSISDDGNLICFGTSSAAVSDDTNGVDDIFVRNRSANTTVRVSLTETNTQSAGASRDAVISGDGKFVVFTSDAPDLVTGDENSAKDVFRRDLINSTTIRVSVSDAEGEANAPCLVPSISDDGNLVAFLSEADNLVAMDTNGQGDAFVRNVMAGTTTRVSVTNAGNQGGGGGANESAMISGDGTAVVFGSSATNLVSGDTNGVTDVFVRDLIEGTTELLSITRAGVRNDDFASFPLISQNGRYVGFLARSKKLDSRVEGVQLTGFGFDRETRNIACIHFNQNGQEGENNFGITGSSTPYFANDGHFYFDSSAQNLLVPGPNPTFGRQIFGDIFSPPPFVDPNIALKARLQKKLKTLQKKLKRAKKARKKGLIKKFKRQTRTLKKKIRAL